MDCLFCKIAQGEIPCQKIYESKSAVAFLDIKPHALGHTVIIPKKHAVTIFELTDSEIKEFMIEVKRVMVLLQKKLTPDGFNVGWNHGPAGGQVVPHLHFHILPRYNGDGGGSMHSIVKNPGKKTVDEVYGLFK